MSWFNRKCKVLTEQEKEIRNEKFFDRCHTAYTIGTVSISLFAIIFVITISAIIILTLFGHHAIQRVSIALAVSLGFSIFFEFVGFCGLGISEYYRLFRGLTGQKALYIYLKRMVKIRYDKNMMPCLRRKLLINKPISYWFINSCIIELLHVCKNLTQEEKLAIKEFSKNIRRFDVITKISDKKVFDTISPYLDKLAISLMNFPNSPSQFLKDYNDLKTAYNKRPDYLKQFKISELYDINKKWRRVYWLLEKLVLPLVITLVLFSIIVILNGLGIKLPIFLPY
ncbi:MAG: hypothetical protein QXN16_03860 [Candidatus Micrarchaeaceae archaeon]